MKSRQAIIADLMEQTGISEDRATMIVDNAQAEPEAFARRHALIEKMRSEPDKSRKLKGIQVRCTEPSVKRNAPCPCGSGKKFKKCCLKKGREIGIVVHQEEEIVEVLDGCARARASGVKIHPPSPLAGNYKIR